MEQQNRTSKVRKSSEQSHPRSSYPKHNLEAAQGLLLNVVPVRELLNKGRTASLMPLELDWDTPIFFYSKIRQVKSDGSVMPCSSPMGTSEVPPAGESAPVCDLGPAGSQPPARSLCPAGTNGLSEKSPPLAQQRKPGTTFKIVMSLDVKELLKILQFVRVIFKDGAAVCVRRRYTFSPPCEMEEDLEGSSRQQSVTSSVLRSWATTRHINTWLTQTVQWGADGSTPDGNSGTFGHTAPWLRDSDRPLTLLGFRFLFCTMRRLVRQEFHLSSFCHIDVYLLILVYSN